MRIWGIINLTADSFYAPSCSNPADFSRRLKNALESGVDVVDLGAESTRPFSQPVSEEEEWNRLYPALVTARNLLGAYDFARRISVDSYKASTIEKSLEMGVRIINHIKGGGKDVFTMVADHNASIVIMHTLSAPATMQIDPHYEDAVREIYSYLEQRSMEAKDAGISSDNIIWDFGVGFGKTMEHNLYLLKNIPHFKKSGFRLLVGLSRKSFMGKLLGLDSPEDRLVPTAIFHSLVASSMGDEDILRVHDFTEGIQLKQIMNAWGHTQLVEV